jgi:hypothetical protein
MKRNFIADALLGALPKKQEIEDLCSRLNKKLK